MNVSHLMVKQYPVVAGTHGDDKWIQQAMTHIKKGALTKTAKGEGYKSPLEFAEEVLKNPEAHTEKTRKQAQFLVNIQKRRK